MSTSVISAAGFACGAFAGLLARAGVESSLDSDAKPVDRRSEVCVVGWRGLKRGQALREGRTVKPRDLEIGVKVQ